MSVVLPFGEDVWISDGPIVRCFGFPFPTRMIVVRLSNGGLWINSPVESSPEEMNGIATFGRVEHLVSPTPLHDWRLESWARVFPGATCRKANELRDDPPQQWAADIDQLVFRGSRVLNEVQFFHRKSRTLIMGDFIQNYPPTKNAIRNTLFAWAGVNGGMPLDARLSFAGNKAAGRASLERLLTWDFDKVILAHGDCVVSDARPFVQRAFQWLC